MLTLRCTTTIIERTRLCRTSSLKGAWKRNFPVVFRKLRQTDRLNDQPTNRLKDMRVNREVTHPTIFVGWLVGPSVMISFQDGKMPFMFLSEHLFHCASQTRYYNKCKNYMITNINTHKFVTVRE